MTKIVLAILIVHTLFSCMKGQKADLVIHNAVIYSMDDNNTVYEAVAIRDGKIIELGPERQILNKYSYDQSIDAQGREIYPGLTDAHGHLMAYADMKLGVNLFGSKSMSEILVRTEKYIGKTNRKFIVGNGWDQSMWSNDSLPNNDRLNAQFPDIPICLTRIDGHAILANDAALNLIKFTPDTKIDGGMVVVRDGKCTGLLLDNAMDSMLTIIPKYAEKDRIEALLQIQNELLQYGIVSVHEAGIENGDIPLFKKIAENGQLKMDVYGMLRNSPENITFAKKNGKINWGSFYISSFKMFADGALGSRGALLKKPYSDDHNHIGIQTTSYSDMQKLTEFCLKHDYQLNTHAIGDSSNAILLDLYKRAFEVKKDHRWRIEHAQVIDPKDFRLFAEYGVFPSVQPTHAISDMRWAEDRLGPDRLKGAYAYKSILNQTGIMALGTDFPFDRINPYLTIFAATQRKNMDNQPSGGFMMNEALTLEECLRGMTRWAAFACFRENETGSLEDGKEATLIMLDKPMDSGGTFRQNFSLLTIIRGETVYSVY